MTPRPHVARAALAASLALLAGCSHQPDPLVTGKFIPPRPPHTQDVGSLPMNLLLTPDGRYAISTDMGYYQALWSTRTSDGQGVSHVDFPNTTRALPPAGEVPNPTPLPANLKSNGLYYGLAFSPDARTLYAAQGAHDTIAILSLSPDGQLAFKDSLPTRPHDFPAGLATDSRGLLYVSNNAAGDGDPFKLHASVAIYDPATRHELGRYTFSDSHFGTSNFPLGLTTLRDGSKTYVASERDDCVYVLDTHDPAHPALLTTLPTGAHPVSVLLTRDQHTLFVANSLSDTISLVDTDQDKILSTILLRPRTARDLPGVTPTSLALSPDEKTLYATLGDMNAVAVIELTRRTPSRHSELSPPRHSERSEESQPSADQSSASAASRAKELASSRNSSSPTDGTLLGYFPTGWYPSALAVTPDGKRILVANAKGHATRNPNNLHDPHDPKRPPTALTVLEGNVTSLDVPSRKDLPSLTETVLKQNRLDTLATPLPNPLRSIGLSAGRIIHVFYVIKENRTYDQVLSDLPQGNGDPSLLLFGQTITPNQHALASRFVLLDNLYACGEVSGDGWDWSTQGMANAYVIRNIPYNYSHRGRRFDEEGQNNGYPVAGAPATDDDGKPLWTASQFKHGAKPIPDVANTGRNIWDTARAAGLSLRNYGFFSYNAESFVGVPHGPDNYPAATGLLPGGHDLAGTTDVDYRRFDMDYPDSDAPDFYYKQTGDKNCLFPATHYGRAKAPSRFAEWNREFQLMLKKDPAGSAVPNLSLIRLPTDHSVGAKSGQHAPESYVADNDYALGQIVQAISNSPIWPHCAIFVIEDDAQSGIDHVDAHRTTGFVISPWIKKNSVDHRFYNTDSMLKTIELLLGLPPLCQYDAVADPILDWDSAPDNIAPYFATMPPKSLIAKRNPPATSLAPTDPRRKLAEASDRMDFAHADAAPARELDAITWHLLRGPSTPLPTAHNWSPSDKDDDD